MGSEIDDERTRILAALEKLGVRILLDDEPEIGFVTTAEVRAIVGGATGYEARWVGEGLTANAEGLTTQQRVARQAEDDRQRVYAQRDAARAKLAKLASEVQKLVANCADCGGRDEQCLRPDDDLSPTTLCNICGDVRALLKETEDGK